VHISDSRIDFQNYQTPKILNLKVKKMVKKTIILTGSVVCGVIIAGYMALMISKSRTFQPFGEIISRVNTTDKVVALTFDDAPTAYTSRVLDILRTKNAKATFYLIGKQIKSDEKTTREIVASGAEIGNHTYSHQRMIFKSWSFIDSEIQKTNSLIRASGYEGEITFRPPNGKKLVMLPLYLYLNQIKTIMWDIEPDTYHQGNAAEIEKYVLDRVKSGSIILMHPFCTKECEADRIALPGIIDGIRSRGFSLVTVSELLGRI
jgi:peptidoglycan-N-acetylglucosamine deacetylase